MVFLNIPFNNLPFFNSSLSNASMASTTSSRKASTSEDKENFSTLSDSTASVASSAALLLLQAEKAKQEKISVKERTKTFNRMASQVEVAAGQQGTKVCSFLKGHSCAILSSLKIMIIFSDVLLKIIK